MHSVVRIGCFVTLLVGAVTAQAGCDTADQGAPDYDRATKVVMALPEVLSWSKSHSFPVAFMPVVDKQQQIAKRCFWSVTVYASRPEKMELWKTFFVQVEGSAVMVANLEGEPVPLKAWRKERSK